MKELMTNDRSTNKQNGGLTSAGIVNFKTKELA